MLDLLPESLVFTCAKILFLVSLLFEESWQNFIPSFLTFVALLEPFYPYSPFKYLIYY